MSGLTEQGQEFQYYTFPDNRILKYLHMSTQRRLLSGSWKRFRL